MTHRYLAPCAAAAFLIAAAGCNRAPTSQPASADQKLLLYCGAGIQPPVAEIAEAFSQQTGVKIEADYAGSEVLLTKIKLHPRGDLYMPGDKSYVDLADKQGLVLSSTPVCFFVPTILVHKGNPKGIKGLADLLRPDVKIGLGDEEACAIGRQSRKIFEKNHIPWSEVNKKVSFKSQTVNELGAHIQTGSLDAVIVWDAVASQYAEHGQQVEIPPRQNVISTVPLAVLKSTQQQELANRFVEFATSERGKAIFTKYHYRVQAPETTER
jgi:molybdate transport system substrate-binding protein